MSNNLLNQTNFFAQDFDQSLFFFYPKQFTFDLKLDGIEVINSVSPVGNFNPINPSIELLRPIDTTTSFNALAPLLEFIETKYSGFTFDPTAIIIQCVQTNLGNAELSPFASSLEAIGLNKQLMVQTVIPASSSVIFILESSQNISISI